MIEAGQLNRRVTILNPPTLTPDGIGGFTETQGKSVIVWAAAEQIVNQEREMLNFGLKEVIAMYHFTFRYDTAKALTHKHKIIYMGRQFKIARIADPKEANVMIKVTAYEPRD